ncbi:MAG: SDR family NAD(P)-dependent oxidoreductase, partial [Steroidobacteraceae bacterium]
MFVDNLMKGQRVLVTGGGTGLGLGIAEKLLTLGAEVHICGRREAVCRAAAAQLVAAHGGKVVAHGVDIRDADAVDRMIESIFADGPLTGLVNNAAGNFISRTEDLSSRGFNAIADIVMRGTFYVTHAVGRRWIAAGSRGSVVSIIVTWVRNGGPFVVPST